MSLQRATTKSNMNIIKTIASLTAGKKELIIKILKSMVMWYFGFIMLVPFLWMISSSFKDPISMFTYPIQWIPKTFNLQSYRDVWMSEVPFARFYINSTVVVILAMIGTFFTCSMAGYGYSKVKFPGRDKLFMLKLATTMIPYQVIMLPTLLIYKHLGLVDTLTALWLPTFFGQTFGVFLMRQYFISVPEELSQAAKIDGCGHFRIYWAIMLPLAKPALATLMFLYFTWTWNNYEMPLIFLRTPEKYTLPLALKYFTDENYTNYSAIMAAAVSSSVPIIILFFTAQKYFVRGITSTGIKG